jgi:tRNA(Ile)-lysidine synthase TilS/MesJ
VAYSGGKDSSFLLHLLAQKYGLRLLALTMDNGFLSPQAEINMHRVTRALRVDWVVVRPRPEMLRTIFKRSMEGPLFASKSSQRGSFICLSCIGLIKFLSLRYAIELHIPFLGFGWSPGQTSIRAALMKNTPPMIRSMQHATFEPLYALVGEEIRPYFLEEKHFQCEAQFPYSVAPLVFTDYREEEIYSVIETLGWEHPQDTDANSSNCLLNALANQVHKQRFNFHPYDYELAQLVRAGYLSREEALARITSEENSIIVGQVAQQLSA